MSNPNHDEMGRFSVATLGTEKEPNEVMTELFSSALKSEIPDSRQKIAIMDLPNGGKILAIHKPVSSNSRGARRGSHLTQSLTHVPAGEQYGKTISRERAHILLASHGYGTKQS